MVHGPGGNGRALRYNGANETSDASCEGDENAEDGSDQKLAISFAVHRIGNYTGNLCQSKNDDKNGKDEEKDARDDGNLAFFVQAVRCRNLTFFELSAAVGIQRVGRILRHDGDLADERREDSAG